jgi:phosphatidylglycerol:prolipoprotein diacylglycerol transferase
MYPVMWAPFGFEISSFGVMVAIGFLVSERIVARRLGEQGLPRELSSTILLYAVISGILGAKLYYAVDMALQAEADASGEFWRSLFSRGGMTWFGGFLAGVLGVTIGTRLHGITTGAVAAAVANAAPFGQACGRIGCFLVGDDYGRPTDGWYGVAFPEGLPPTTVPVHPTQLYEAAWLVAIGALLWRRRAASPLLFAEYLVLAGIGRFAVEILRINPRIALDLSAAQWIGIAMVGVGGALWLRAKRSARLQIGARS